MSAWPPHIPHLTVATLIERDQKFLMIEEDFNGLAVLNQPAGHLELGETLIEAAVRESLEESGWHVNIKSLIGIYLYKSPLNGETYHRTCFSASPIEKSSTQELDKVIIDTHWMNRDQVAQRHSQLRSPIVLQCIDDYLQGKSYPTTLLNHYIA